MQLTRYGVSGIIASVQNGNQFTGGTIGVYTAIVDRGLDTTLADVTPASDVSLSTTFNGYVEPFVLDKGYGTAETFPVIFLGSLLTADSQAAGLFLTHPSDASLLGAWWPFGWSKTVTKPYGGLAMWTRLQLPSNVVRDQSSLTISRSPGAGMRLRYKGGVLCK